MTQRGNLLLQSNIHSDLHHGLLLTTLVTGFGIAFLHTLIPVHWLPYALTGRARGWSLSRTLAVNAAPSLQPVQQVKEDGELHRVRRKVSQIRFGDLLPVDLAQSPALGPFDPTYRSPLAHVLVPLLLVERHEHDYLEVVQGGLGQLVGAGTGRHNDPRRVGVALATRGELVDRSHDLCPHRGQTDLVEPVEDDEAWHHVERFLHVVGTHGVAT